MTGFGNLPEELRKRILGSFATGQSQVSKEWANNTPKNSHGHYPKYIGNYTSSPEALQRAYNQRQLNTDRHVAWQHVAKRGNLKLLKMTHNLVANSVAQRNAPYSNVTHNHNHPNHRHIDYGDVLYGAASVGNIPVMKWVLETWHFNEPQLSLAQSELCGSGNLDALKWFKHKYPGLVKWSFHCLQRAIQNNRMKMVRFLILNRCPKSSTAFDHAKTYKMVTLLVKLGVKMPSLLAVLLASAPESALVHTDTNAHLFRYVYRHSTPEEIDKSIRFCIENGIISVMIILLKKGGFQHIKNAMRYALTRPRFCKGRSIRAIFESAKSQNQKVILLKMAKSPHNMLTMVRNQGSV